MKTKKTRILKALIAISLLALLTLLASCANNAVILDASPQGIEVQAEEAADKTFIKDRHDKEHGKGHDKGNRGKQGQVFEVVASTIGIDMPTLKTELDVGKSIATIAQENGVAPQTVIDSLVAKSQARMDAAIAAGKLTAEDAAAWQAKLIERFSYFVNNTQEAFAKASGLKSKEGKGAHDKKRGGKGKDKFASIAELIGIDTKTLYTELKAGKSIADVATANGVAPQTIIDALLIDMQAKLDAMVTAGKLSSDEAAEKASAMKEQIIAWVNGTVSAKGRK